jgi:NAD/NADP octopine/nopaline dehydrogenase, alpha-helical domain
MNTDESPGLGQPDRPLSVTICGSGNGAHALAVVASQNPEAEISWLVGSEEKADRLRRALATVGLRSTGAITAVAQRVATVSADPGDVIPHADMVMIVVPAFGHAAVLRRIEPHIRATTAIGCIPTRGGFEFDAARLAPRNDATRPLIFGLQTLPWSTRVTTYGELVNIGAAKEQVVLASLPASEAPVIAARMSHLLATEIVPAASFLSLTLGNPGQFIHPGLMYGHFRSWQGEAFDEAHIPMFYADATDEMGEIVDRLSREAIAVAAEIERRSQGALRLREAVVPIHEWLTSTYRHVTRDTSSVGTCFRTGPIQARKAPVIETPSGAFIPDFQYRYLTEDVPFGLVATRALAELAHVETPTIDAVITWAQSAMERVYLADGRLQGRDVTDLPIPQNHGVSTLSELASWYRRGSLLAA